jgi:hypothetical protein
MSAPPANAMRGLSEGTSSPRRGRDHRVNDSERVVLLTLVVILAVLWFGVSLARQDLLTILFAVGVVMTLIRVFRGRRRFHG